MTQCQLSACNANHRDSATLAAHNRAAKGNAQTGSSVAGNRYSKQEPTAIGDFPSPRKGWGEINSKGPWYKNPQIGDCSCSGHGGLYVPKELNSAIPSPLRNNDGWYEEDDEANFVAAVFCATEDEREEAKRSIRDSFPDKYEAAGWGKATVENSWQRRAQAKQQAISDSRSSNPSTVFSDSSTKPWGDHDSGLHVIEGSSVDNPERRVYIVDQRIKRDQPIPDDAVDITDEYIPFPDTTPSREYSGERLTEIAEDAESDDWAKKRVRHDGQIYTMPEFYAKNGVSSVSYFDGKYHLTAGSNHTLPVPQRMAKAMIADGVEDTSKGNRLVAAMDRAERDRRPLSPQGRKLQAEVKAERELDKEQVDAWRAERERLVNAKLAAAK